MSLVIKKKIKCASFVNKQICNDTPKQEGSF